MIQIPKLTKACLLSGCGAAAVWAVLALPEGARASTQAATVPNPGRSFSRLQLENARDRLIAVNDAFVEIGAVLKSSRITGMMSENRGRILTMDDATLSAVAASEPHLVHLQAAAETMRSTIVSAKLGAGAGSPSVPGGGSHNLTDGFPDADPCDGWLPPSGYTCETEAIVRAASEDIEWLGETVCDGLKTVVVAAGFGGNFSFGCIVLHILTLAGKVAEQLVTLELGEYKDADAKAVYLRTGHIHTDIQALSTSSNGLANQLVELNDKLVALDHKLDSLKAHLDVRLAEIQADVLVKANEMRITQCEALRLLCLPQAWRHSEIPNCSDQSCWPYQQELCPTHY